MENENGKTKSSGTIVSKAFKMYKKSDEVWVKYAQIILPIGLLYAIYLLIEYLIHKIGI